MGLDQYAFACFAEKIAAAAVDFDHGFGIRSYTRADENPTPAIQLQYWRKHPNLHGWMERRYRERGGKNQFNGDAIRLTVDDINQLENDVKAKTLPYTSGFFFGESTERDEYDDLQFISQARNALAMGLAVYYTSSW